MNERIQELKKQARKYAWENETHWSANAEREALFEEKFAELIVRECANISDASFHNGSAGYTAILKYFGVEE